MARRSKQSLWTRSLQRTASALTRSTIKAGSRALTKSLRAPTAKKARGLTSQGDWITGVAMASMGARRYHLFKPAGVQLNERLPLLVMLHGCGQDAQSFALSTRMNRLAARERFLVLYPEQDRRANPQGCWNWYGTRTKVAYGEAAILMAAVQQVSLLYPVDPHRIAIAGMSAGASMAALMVTRYPDQFRAVAMHSGVPPGAAESSVSALAAMRGRGAIQALSTSTNWPALLVIHGDQDVIVAASNGQAAARLWAEAAGPHVEKSRQVSRGQRHPMTVTDFKVRGGRTVATLCAIDGLAHAWSGGQARQAYSDAQGPDASRMIWSFAARQFEITKA
ncbi:MAG: PHB depolymerase family esterase [Aquabacterium sp.]|uniref:extracellular catalytic domain type 1 short-chain-length polyhydroxyalkanoate depolymerase n=1 Tax=Aquabacterium sp. TaxID=1872578 RepID=UPI00271645F4|nr:PHB depolymerase family esterase [Aquabacterium sp.]MDO9005424.1 PHB depolymerase family esterase [Aquabacterium sp.]